MRLRIRILCPLYLTGAVLLYIAGYMNCLEKNWSFAGLCALLSAFLLLCFGSSWVHGRYLRMRLKKVDKLSGESFEQYLKIQFARLGYQVRTTEATGDYGADLLLKKRGKVVVVQAKRYEKPVGISAVQEVIGAMAYYGSDQGMVVTNRTFTKNARNLAEQSNVELWDRARLKKEFGLRE